MAAKDPSQKLNVLEEEDEEKEQAEQETATHELAQELDIPPEEAADDVIELPDGSVVVNLQETRAPFEDDPHYANLAEKLEQEILHTLAVDYLDFIRIDKEARVDRDKQYEEGIRRTGMGEPQPGGNPKEGGSKVGSPLLAEAVIEFAARSAKELIPSGDIVKTNIRSQENNKDLLEKADRKAAFLNWQLNESCEEYRAELEQLLTQLPLGGSQFLKWFYNHDLHRPQCEWVPIDKIYLPFGAADFYTAGRVTEEEMVSMDRLQMRIDQGLYRQIDGIDSDYDYGTATTDEDHEDTRSETASHKIEGKARPEKDIDGMRTIYHVYCFLRLKEDPQTKGERAPYLMVIDEESKDLLALYRNWEAGDKRRRKLDWLVEFKFIPWRGAYGIGLPHLIGQLTAAATGALRALMDAAQNSNFPGYVSLKSGLSGVTDRIEPNQIVEIGSDTGVDDVRKAMMPIPFPQPSPVLLQLLELISNDAKNIIGVAEEKIADVNANTPVGTTQALMESSGRVLSSIHARLHRAQCKSLKILSRLNYWYLDEMENESGSRVEVRDFASNDLVSPVSDPNIFSETQRLSQAQAVMQLYQAAKDPSIYDERTIHKKILEAMKIPYAQEILPDPDGIVESNPVLENLQMSMGKLAAAYPDQDHIAHMYTHLTYAMDPNYGSNPLIGPALAPKMLQHLKQHFELHYLQSMRDAVKRDDPQGDDIFDLHEEKPLSIMAQQSIMMIATKVSEQNKDLFTDILKCISELQQKVAKAEQGKQQNIINSDPASAVLMQTSKEKLAFEAQKAQQDSQLRQAENAAKAQTELGNLGNKVDELQGKLETDRMVDANKNATAVAISAMNNESRERTEAIKLGVQATSELAAYEHERMMAANAAVTQAQQQMQVHGLDIEKQNMQNQHELVQGMAQNGIPGPAAPPAPPPAPTAAPMPAPNMAGGGLIDEQMKKALGGDELTKDPVIDHLLNKGPKR